MTCTPVAVDGGVAIVRTRTSPPPLKAITEACLSAQSRGWTRAQVKQALLAHGAEWKDKKVTHVPSNRRKKLLSVLLHHPSWWHAATAYCAQLNVMGFPYPLVKAACLELGWSPPSMVATENRKILAGMLADPESRIRETIADVLRRKQ